MSALARKPMSDTDTLVREKNERIGYARERDFAALVRSIVGDSMPQGDVDSLVEALSNSVEAQVPITRENLVRRLVALGRSRDKAETMASALIK